MRHDVKPGDDLRMASGDDESPLHVGHKELLSAMAMLVFHWETTVDVRLAPELANVCAALRAAGRPYITITKAPATKKGAPDA